MTDFALAHATGDSREKIVAALAGTLGSDRGFNLGFVYATSELAPSFAALVAGLKAETGIPAWVGTVGHGVCATGVEHFGGMAAVALACRLEPGSFELVPSLTDEAAVKAIARPAMAAGLGVVHGDPRNGGVIDIVAELARQRGAYLVGGLSSANSAFPQAAGGHVVEGGVSGVLLGGRLNVAVGLTQGCSPVGPTHEVTRGEGQLIAMLDGQRAFDVLCEDVGIAEGADPRPWLANIHAALPVPGSKTADYVVRNLIGIDPRQGLVAVAERLGRGDRVLFVRRDRESAEKDLARMLADLATRAGKRPRAGLYYSCVARGPNLFASAAHEMRAIQAAFGDIPVVGFFGNGEISNDRVYGYTGVLALFS